MKRGLVICIMLLALSTAYAVSIDCSAPAESSVPVGSALCAVSVDKNTDVSVCLQDQCKRAFAGTFVNVPMQIPQLMFGEHEYVFDVYAGSDHASSSVTITYLSVPVIDLLEVTVPSAVRYSEEFPLTMDFRSVEPRPLNVTFLIRDRVIHETSVLDHETLSVLVDGSLLYKPLSVEAVYYDMDGVRYEASWPIAVSLADLSFLDKVSLFFRQLFAKTI